MIECPSEKVAWASIGYLMRLGLTGYGYAIDGVRPPLLVRDGSVLNVGTGSN